MDEPQADPAASSPSPGSQTTGSPSPGSPTTGSPSPGSQTTGAQTTGAPALGSPGAAGHPVGAEPLPAEQIDPAHGNEAHEGDLSGRLNWLRAGVLGANDGIVSVAGLVVGVAGATSSRGTLLTAGVAGLVAGALSMAGGEYVSVSTQRDTERAMLTLERWELENLPEHELEELTQLYRRKGISEHLARQVAQELTAHNALHAHAEAELGINPHALSSPWQAAVASFVSFFVGAMLPLIAILLPPASARVPVCFAAVVCALVLTGYVSARLGQAPAVPAILRNVAAGALGMAVTYGVGALVGTRV